MKYQLILIGLCACGAHDANTMPDAMPTPADAAVDAAPPSLLAVPLEGTSWSFTGTFMIGGAPFRLTVDTGSNALAVAAQGCTTCTAAGVADLYSPGATATDEHEAASATYDDGDMWWKGELYQDSVAIDGVSSRVDLAAITSDQNFFGTWGSPDGIVGLAGSGATSFMTEIAAGGVPDVLALHECASAGTLWVGGYDTAAVTAAPSFVPMYSAVSSYSVDVSDVAVDGTSIGLPATSYGEAIVDSGGPNIFLPTAAYTAVTNAIAANATFASSFGDATWFTTAQDTCAQPTMTKAELDAALPTLTIDVGGTPVTMAATDSYLMTIREDDGSTYFCPALVGQDGFLDLGNALIRSHVVIFDRAHAQMGFAPTAACI